MITIQDTIKKAISIKGPKILKDKKCLCVLLEDLSPTLKEEREFIEKVYSDGVGKILFEAYLADTHQKMEYIKEADVYLENNYGFNEKWRKRLLLYFVDRIPTKQEKQGLHKVLFRVLSQGEEKRDLGVFVGDSMDGKAISKNLSQEPLMKILYNERTKELGIRNLSSEPWTIVFPDAEKKTCNPGQIQVLEQGMMIRIIPRVAQLNVLAIEKA